MNSEKENQDNFEVIISKIVLINIDSLIYNNNKLFRDIKSKFPK